MKINHRAYDTRYVRHRGVLSVGTLSQRFAVYFQFANIRVYFTLLSQIVELAGK